MAQALSIKDLQGLIVTCSGCLALVILVVGILFGIITGAIQPEHLGSVKGFGVGGGLLGLASIIGLVIKISLKGGSKE